MTWGQRRRALVGATVCLLVVGLLAWMVGGDRAPLGSIDGTGRTAEAFTAHHAWLVPLLRVVEVSFATVGMIVWSSIVTAALLYRRRFRAAAWVVVVMVTTSVATSLLKIALARGRPSWQDHVHLVASKSFPSGHASSTAALAGMLVVLLWGQAHHSRGHLVAVLLLVATWLVVCLDRVLLGRHYPTDVVAGSALGVAVMLFGLAILDPIPMAPRSSSSSA